MKKSGYIYISNNSHSNSDHNRIKNSVKTSGNNCANNSHSNSSLVPARRIYSLSVKKT